MFLEVLQELYPKSTIVGGMVEVAFRINSSRKIENSRSGVVGLALAGNVPLHALVSRGTIPCSPTFNITSSTTTRRTVGGGLTQELLVVQTVRPMEGGGGDLSIEGALNMSGVSGDYDCCGIREAHDESFLIKDFDFVSVIWIEDSSKGCVVLVTSSSSILLACPLSNRLMREIS